MLRRIDWYIIRETIPPFLLSLVIFTFLLEIPPVMRELEMLVAKGVSWPVAGRIVLTLIPQALGLTIPRSMLQTAVERSGCLAFSWASDP